MTVIPETVRLAALEAVKGNNGKTPNSVLTVAASSVEAVPVRWLWSRHIARGFLNLLTGPAGVGKSTTLYDLAARVSREGGTVLIATAEDHLAAVVRPRLEAAEADLSRVHLVTDELTLPADVERLEARAQELGAVLVICDPLVAFLDGGIDSHKDASVRQALRPLAGMAERIDAAVVCVVHTNKSPSDDPLFRISGSGGFAAAARHVLLACSDPADETGARRVLAVVKSNLSEFPPPISYAIEAATVPGVEGPITTSRIRWGEEMPGLDPRSLLRAPMREEDRGALGEALEFLEEMVTEPTPAADVMSAAADLGISKRTLQRARQQLGIATKRAGFGGKVEWLPPLVPTIDANVSVGALALMEQPAETEALSPIRASAKDTGVDATGDPVMDRALVLLADAFGPLEEMP